MGTSRRRNPFFLSNLLVVFLLVVAAAFVFVDATAAGFTSSSDEEIGLYELKKGNFSVKLTNYGATVVSVLLPDSKGKLADVVLGFDSIEDYKNDTSYLGRIVGRVANRIGGAQFTLNGTTYKLVANEGKNILHGGPRGFSSMVWKVRSYRKDGVAPRIAFTYHSSDGEEGFPGSLSVKVTYALIGENSLVVVMRARAKNKPTPVNLAQHTYWNLGGHNSGDILSNTVQLFASKITPVDDSLIPTGEFVPVKGTPYDFLQPRTVGSRINEVPKGYDINYVLGMSMGKKVKKAAVVQDNKSGRVMELWTNAPGVQLYTANMLHGVKGKGGFVYGPHAALCLETQAFPDSVNHPNFPSEIVVPDKPYQHVMLYKFTTKAPASEPEKLPPGPPVNGPAAV